MSSDDIDDVAPDGLLLALAEVEDAAPTAAAPTDRPCADAAARASASPSGTTTYLFTDIVSSTAEWETSSDMADRLQRHLTILQDAVAAHGGSVFSSMGDGIAAAFASAGAAVHAAVAAQRELPASGLHARMGLHTGEAERVGSDHRGRPVIRAARVMAVARGGQILLSDLCAALVRSSTDPVELIEVGRRRLRGLRDPERLWQVVDPARDRSGVSTVDPAGDRPIVPAGREAAPAPARPRPRTPLLGRTREVSRVADLVRRARVVTLTGPGGVGKTRLALHVADGGAPWADVVFVELANLPARAESAEVAHAVAVAMGVGATDDPIAAVASTIDHDGALLVIDSCEHVVEGAAAVVGDLTDAAPRVTVIATSREPLGIDGEHVVRVRPLRTADATTLFRWRAEAAGVDPQAVDEDLSIEIVRHLDGLPLAIELAAARAATLGLRAIADGLRRRSPLPARHRRGRVGRQATMAATIAWSYDLLSAGEQRLLRRLAVFPNGLELDAVVHLAGQLGVDPDTATDDLASLVDRSMVIAEANDRGVRYRLLETMRSFLLDQLDATGERAAAQLAMAEWVASLTDVPYDEACGPVALSAAVRLEREADNWRDAVLAAAACGRPALAARLCGPPTAFFLLGRHDLADHVRAVVGICCDHPDQRRATLCALMVSASGTSDPGQIQDWADEMVAIERVTPTGLGHLMQWLSRIWNGDFDGAVATCLAGADDPRLSDTTRDLLLGIAVLDRFSLAGATSDPDGLIDRALACAERSPVALARVTSRLGAAWGLIGTAPDRCIELVRQAMADLDEVPAITRLTLPGSASRLLAGLAPSVAAEGLLDQLDAFPSRRSFVDLIPLSYARALLARVGHPAADVVAAESVDSRLSMMDVVEQARCMASRSGPDGLGEVEASLRAALVEVAGGAAPVAGT